MRNLGPTEKILLNKGSINKGGPQLNIITSILDLLKILSEVIVTSKCVPRARVEKQGMS